MIVFQEMMRDKLTKRAFVIRDNNDTYFVAYTDPIAKKGQKPKISITVVMVNEDGMHVYENKSAYKLMMLMYKRCKKRRITMIEDGEPLDACYKAECASKHLTEQRGRVWGKPRDYASQPLQQD